MQINRLYAKLKLWVRGKLFKQETGFMLNYITLDISNEAIRHQMRVHRADQYGRLVYVYFAMTVIATIYNLLLYLFFRGHPLLVVTSGITLSGYILFFYWYFTKNLWKATYLCVPYLLVHTVASVCCYRGWLLPGLTIPNKDIFDF